MSPFVRGENGVSGTKILFSVFGAIVCVKYAVAGVTVAGFAFGTFNGQGAALVLGALGATYAGRRYTEAHRV